MISYTFHSYYLWYHRNISGTFPKNVVAIIT